MTKFRKFRFTNGKEHTAALIMESAKLIKMPVTEVSRLFPYSEAPKMRTFEMSPAYETWEQAFEYQFKKGN